MSTAEKHRPYYTYEDYLQWEGNWELIDGMPYAMSPQPTFRHQRIASEMNALFVMALKKCKKCKVYEPINWKIKEDTILQPDLSIFCRPIANQNFCDFPPALVVEILSPSTSLKDRKTKFEIYEAQGVKYYLIIDPTFNKLEVFELIDQAYQPVAVNPVDYDFLLDACKARIDFSDLFEE
jgi:Uma2 family endonuclease